MSISVNHATAEAQVQKAWDAATDSSQPPTAIALLIESVMQATDVTYKYILVTGLLGKCAEPRIHPRALQAGSSLHEAYDARSLCHNVIVPFEHEHGDLFGRSNEPFLNKPARHPEHDKANSQLRNKELAAQAHDALEWANKAKAAEVFSALVHVLRLAKARASNLKQAVVPADANLTRVISFGKEFLKETSGGARLAAVWGALTALLNESANVEVGLPTRSDTFAGASGDVEVFVDDVLVSATECKHRPLNADDVKHGIKKALEKGTPQYLFVLAAGIAAGQEDAIDRAVKEGSELVDTAILEIHEILPGLAAMLGPHRRGVFGERVVNFLRDMHRIEAANEAASIWNELG